MPKNQRIGAVFAIRLTLRDNALTMIELPLRYYKKEYLVPGLAIAGAILVLWLTLRVISALVGADNVISQQHLSIPRRDKPQIQYDALYGVYKGSNLPLQETALQAKLLGIFATQDPFSGSAVISVSGRQSTLVPVGKRVANGIIIKEVYPDYVVLEEAGERSVLRLPKKGL